jgi:hypothetical protein
MASKSFPRDNPAKNDTGTNMRKIARNLRNRDTDGDIGNRFATRVVKMPKHKPEKYKSWKNYHGNDDE